jgi:amino acid transporter
VRPAGKTKDFYPVLASQVGDVIVFVGVILIVAVIMVMVVIVIVLVVTMVIVVGRKSNKTNVPLPLHFFVILIAILPFSSSLLFPSFLSSFISPFLLFSGRLGVECTAYQRARRRRTRTPLSPRNCPSCSPKRCPESPPYCGKR